MLMASRFRSLFHHKNSPSDIVEPLPCYRPLSAEANCFHFVWRGFGPGRKATTIGVFDGYTEQWSLKNTTGPSPPGVYGGQMVSRGNCLYAFGGENWSSCYNDMHKLGLDTFKWGKVHSTGTHPIKKSSFGLVCVNDTTLCCFGGYGIIPKQPGAAYAKSTQSSDGRGWTNEFHFFDILKGVWSSPDIGGEKPPPCSAFSFTKVDQDRAVLFAGYQPGQGARVNDVYVFNFRNMEITKVEPVPGEPWPSRRASHAACCLNYGEDHPQLLVSGGLDNDLNTLGDIWALDVDAGKWTEVTPPEQSIVARHSHSLTAASLGPGLIEILVFGGCLEWATTFDTEEEFAPVAETTILSFELVTPSVSIGEPFTIMWRLEDVRHNNTRGSSQQLREKMIKIREATHGPSQEKVRQDLRAAEEREQALLDLLTEVNKSKAELSFQISTLKKEMAGKSRELVALSTEVWTIPSCKVSTLRTIGSGGWGEVLEGTIKVAVKRLHTAIVNQRNLERLQREMRLLAEVCHPNLVQFIGAVFDQSPPLIITELLDINLRQAYEQNQLKQGGVHSVLIDTARALDYLHQRYEPIIHRDVSAPNVLLQQIPNNQWKGKLSDLGSANFLQHAKTMGEGAIVYSPPEVIPTLDFNMDPPPQTVKIDVYSFGILIAEATVGQFPSQERLRDIFQLVKRDYPHMYDLIVRCTKTDPIDRPSMAEVLMELVGYKH